MVDRLLAIAAAFVTVPIVPAHAQARVAVQQFVVSGNTLVPAERLDAVLAPFKGSRSVEELQQAALAVQSAYRDAGYGAVIAYLPEQSLAAGRVQIAVLEGKVQRVVVIGNQHMSTEQVRRALPDLREGQTPRVRVIDQQVQLANENPSRQIALVFEAGQRAGEVDARVAVNDRPLSSWTLSLDNTGTKQTGDWRAAVAWKHASVAGLDHQLALQYQTSVEKPSQVSIASISYSVPLPAQAMRLDLYAARSDVNGGSTPTAAGALQFVGRGNVLGARLTKLLLRAGEFDQRVGLGLDRREYLNDCSIAGLPDGACGAAGESVAVTPISVDYSLQRGGDSPLGLLLSLSRNLDRGGKHAGVANFDAVRAGAKPAFTSLRVSAFGSLLARSEGWRAQWRVAGQFTPDALVPGEQYGLAGANTVRGYREREVIGDQGLVVNVELVSPEIALLGSGRGWRAIGFADAGRASNHLGAECLPGTSRCTLGSVGVGLRSGPGPWQLRADLAFALKDGNRTERHDARLHLAASVTLP